MNGDMTRSAWRLRGNIAEDGILLSDLAAEERAKGRPFVLLDDQRSNLGTLLTDPEEIIVARDPSGAIDALKRAKDLIGSGVTLAGYVSYRAGAAFDRFWTQNRTLASESAPTIWLAHFRNSICGSVDIDALPRDEANVTPLIDRFEYERMVRRALEHIRSGDIYQVNLTFPLAVDVANPLEYYFARRPLASASLGAVVATGEDIILSFSPELFFGMNGRALEARPMKGTRPRSRDSAVDRAAAQKLAASEKDRAENLMIVDLLRNDMSRVCDPGSISVPELFSIEDYPTVWQMTSNIRGRLRDDATIVSVFQALFPCGSITGAPKIMASRIIADLERWERGPYTGSIGWMNDQAAKFNVAIRTVHCHAGRTNGRLDVGAGIVADSVPSEEWAECLAKARFAGRIRERRQAFDLAGS